MGLTMAIVEALVVAVVQVITTYLELVEQGPLIKVTLAATAAVILSVKPVAGVALDQ